MRSVRAGDPALRSAARPAAGSGGSIAARSRNVAAAIELTGIGSYVDSPVELLSTGQRRLVELARVLAGPFDTIVWRLGKGPAPIASAAIDLSGKVALATGTLVAADTGWHVA
jgi:ABC-type transport system involved in cytochrome c biogenesis ATPase subunit